MTGSASLEAKAVTRDFPETGPVVAPISLSVQPGEFVSILGPSGCGKSTFLRMAAGLDQPSSGSLEVTCPRTDQFRSFVFQEAHLLPWRTVLRNVMLPLELMGVDRKQAQERAEAVLSRVGLDDALKRFPVQLSGGMKMRASVARALVTEPSFLLLDEPFSALDELNRHALQDDLRKLWETSKPTILFVTHSVSEAVYLSNRVVVFSKRPARILLDTTVHLPAQREASLRTTAEFSRELKAIYSRVSYDEAPL